MPGKAVSGDKMITKSSNGYDNRKSLTSPAQKREPMNNASWETQLLQVYGGNASLRYPHIEAGEVTTQSILEPQTLPLQEGVFVTPDVAQVSAYGDGKDIATKGVIFTALGGRVEFAVSNFQQARGQAQLATMNIVSDNNSALNQISLPSIELGSMEHAEMKTRSSVQTGETEISAYLREPVEIELIDGISIQLCQGEYIKRKNEQNPKIKFWQTKLIFKEQEITNDFETEINQNGLHTSQGQEAKLENQEIDSTDAQKVFGIINTLMAQEEPEAVIAQAQPQKARQAQTPQPEAQQAQLQTQEEQLAKPPKDFKPGDFTEDGFVKLEEAEFKPKEEGDTSVKQIGKGKFSFQEIPYTIPLPENKEFKGTTKVKKSGEAMQDFTVDSAGQLQVEFNEPITLELIGNEKIAQYLVTTLRLEQVAVKDGLLTAGKIRIDLGVASWPGEKKEESKDDSEEVKEDEKIAKKLFGENLHGTFAYIGAVNEINKEGIHVGPARKSLGYFDVSKFLGFLDVSGDYPSGQLEVRFEKGEEKEGSHTKLFSEAAQNIMGDGLNIPIVGPLAFKFSISPSVGIDGSLSASLKRGKSFGEPMESGESMELKGAMGIEGKGALGMSAGLALSVPVISNIDIVLSTDLSANIGVNAEAATTLGVSGDKLKQTDKLNLDGDVDMKLKGEGSLSSNVKFLIWKAQLFSIELFKKEVPLLKFKGQASRDADAQGITKGWNFDTMELSAGRFGKKAFKALREAEGSQQTPREELKMSKEAVASLGTDFKDAWVILEELKKQEELAKERAYVIAKEDKEALQKRIEEMTGEVKEKLNAYQQALVDYCSKLSVEQASLKNKVVNAQDKYLNYMKRDDVHQEAMANVQRGGFRPENYRPLTLEERPDMKSDDIKKQNKIRRQMASIDFAIARVLGIHDNAVDFRKAKYDVYAREQNLKLQDAKRRGEQNVGSEYKLSKAMSDDDFFYKRPDEFSNAGAELLRSDTQFGKSSKTNYFDILNGNVLSKSKMPDACRNLFRRKPDGSMNEAIRVYDYLQAILSGVYPKGCYDEKGHLLDGKPIEGLTPQYKIKFFSRLFKDKLSKEEKEEDFLNRLLDGNGYVKKLTEQQAAIADTDKVYQVLFKSNLDGMTAKGEVDIDMKLQELDASLRASREEYLHVLEQKHEVDNVIKEAREELADCQAKLDTLKDNVTQSMNLRANPTGVVNAAKEAVNMIQDEYQDIASGTTLLSTSVSVVSANSDTYKKLKEIGTKELSEAVIDPKKAKKLRASVNG